MGSVVILSHIGSGLTLLLVCRKLYLDKNSMVDAFFIIAILPRYQSALYCQWYDDITPDMHQEWHHQQNHCNSNWGLPLLLADEQWRAGGQPQFSLMYIVHYILWLGGHISINLWMSSKGQVCLVELISRSDPVLSTPIHLWCLLRITDSVCRYVK